MKQKTKKLREYTSKLNLSILSDETLEQLQKEREKDFMDDDEDEQEEKEILKDIKRKLRS